MPIDRKNVRYILSRVFMMIEDFKKLLIKSFTLRGYFVIGFSLNHNAFKLNSILLYNDF